MSACGSCNVAGAGSIPSRGKTGQFFWQQPAKAGGRILLPTRDPLRGESSKPLVYSAEPLLGYVRGLIRPRWEEGLYHGLPHPRPMQWNSFRLFVRRGADGHKGYGIIRRNYYY